MLIFDIGANVGRYSIENAKVGTTLIAIEASPTTYATLKVNVTPFANVTPLHFAICPGPLSTVTFYECTTATTLSTLNKDWLSHPVSRFGTYKNAVREVTVPARTIDSLIQEYGIPELIKVDVEGAEHIVLQSLTQKVPLLCFEWASEWKSQNKACVEHLASLGFTRFHIQLEDAYMYRPPIFEHTASTIIDILSTFTPKKEWGMVWAC